MDRPKYYHKSETVPPIFFILVGAPSFFPSLCMHNRLLESYFLSPARICETVRWSEFPFSFPFHFFFVTPFPFSYFFLRPFPPYLYLHSHDITPLPLTQFLVFFPTTTNMFLFSTHISYPTPEFTPLSLPPCLVWLDFRLVSDFLLVHFFQR